MAELIDGFWLPKRVRERVLCADTEYVTLSFAQGRACSQDDAGAVSVRWPRLAVSQWERLVSELAEGRRRAPRGEAFWHRFQEALRAVAVRFADPSDPLYVRAMSALPSYTGYSPPMIELTLGALDLVSLADFPAAFSLSLTREASREWQVMEGLTGRVRFHEESPWRRLWGRLDRHGGHPLFGEELTPGFVVGYGAGNVPGTALLIGLLAQAIALTGQPPPVTFVKNSRREPIFGPLVLSAMEEADPGLFAALAVLIWDYDDASVQDLLLSRADLVIAAASDDTIAQVGLAIERAARGHGPRFHMHGHKVSFTAVGHELLEHAASEVIEGQTLLEVITLLSALDSAFWDQHGCLSSRVHFVETHSSGRRLAAGYSEQLAVQMRLLSAFLPRGAWPRQQIRDRFDRYKLLESTGKVSVLSDYDDEFVVVLDERPLEGAAFYQLVNDCTGRVIVVRPVRELTEVPRHWLSLIPPQNLQSLSVAVGGPDVGLSPGFLGFAAECGTCGVTAIRTIGRGAFPQLAYSWDGLIPLDLLRTRPAGRFSTIEFDDPYAEMVDTYRQFVGRGQSLGLVAN